MEDDLAKKKLRNLAQYKNLTDEEFERVWQDRLVGIKMDKDFEDRIRYTIEKITKDYDISDLNSNDQLLLRALAQAFITLEDYEKSSYELRKGGITIDNLLMLEKLSRVMSDLRTDISKQQDDLKITRKVRKDEKNVNTIQFIDSLKQKASEFYKSKMYYIYCPKCNMLLGTVWTMYPDEEKNKVQLFCKRTVDGGICGTKVIVTTKEMGKNRGTNNVEIMPEAML
jgi:hypothetical protein